MMLLIENFANGMWTAVQPINLLFVFIGALIGTLVGAFPGLSAPTAIALLLPVTFSLQPTTAIIMLAGIYYGSQFGDAISAVLLGVPGEPSAVVTAIEGHIMAKRGRAGVALAISAISSFAAGIIAVAIFALVGPPLAWLGLRFGPPEYVALITLAFCMLPALGGQGKMKTAVSFLIGLFIANIGLDQMTGKARFIFGQPDLLEGISLVVALIGLFGVADVLHMPSMPQSTVVTQRLKLRELWPTASDWVTMRWPTVRGSLLGFLIGMLPGGGATVAALASYAVERGVAKDKSGFQNGSIEGLAAAEAGNSSASIGAMLPLIVLGIPGSATTAVMLGGFLIWGLEPGPAMFQKHPDFVWGLIASMIIGNAMLLAMCTLLVPVLARLLQLPYSILAALVVVFCAAGAYSADNNMADVWIMFAFAGIAYVFKLANIPLVPLALGMVLGDLFEKNWRNALQISDGSLLIFVQRPISATILILTVLVIAAMAYASFRRRPPEEPGALPIASSGAGD
jgi:putative tricarboxylic transport membrane protein